MIYRISFSLTGKADLKHGCGETIRCVELSDLVAIGSPVKIKPPPNEFLGNRDLVMPDEANSYFVLRKPRTAYNVYDYIVQYYRWDSVKAEQTTGQGMKSRWWCSVCRVEENDV